MPLDPLGGNSNPGSFGHPVHHLEVAEDSGGIEEGLWSQFFDDGGHCRLPGRLITVEEGIDQLDQLVATGNPEWDIVTTDGGDVDLVTESLAAPTEPPGVTEYSVETVVEQRDSGGHRL